MTLSLPDRLHLTWFDLALRGVPYDLLAPLMDAAIALEVTKGHTMRERTGRKTDKIARLRPERARYSRDLDPEQWYHVTEANDLGVYLDLKTGERFVFWQDVEVKDTLNRLE